MTTIKLPWPQTELSQNGRGHRMKLARITKAARASAGWAAKQAQAPRMVPQVLPVTIALHPPDRRQRDEANWQAACKAYIDGIADVIGVDDRFWRIEWVWGDVLPTGGQVIVTLRPLVRDVEFRGTIS